MRHNLFHLQICLNDQKYECHVGLVGEPAQSASQLLRAMRLDRGRPKGRESLTGREQQTRASMGGSPGRLTGQRDQARYGLAIKGIMYAPACKLECCAQICWASTVYAVTCSIVGLCMPLICATAVSVSQTLCCICVRWLPYHFNGASYEFNYMPWPEKRGGCFALSANQLNTCRQLLLVG